MSNTWDEKIAQINWSRLIVEGRLSEIPLDVVATLPFYVEYIDLVGIIKFNSN